ncbi:TonB-dependent receptor [Microbulbifer sp. SA54]|uniref:TonB-dependent receptor n=1 Tax=Microbulbifer sp. SA54 TaxID=3401577 RepID=UPI003AAA48A2
MSKSQEYGGSTAKRLAPAMAISLLAAAVHNAAVAQDASESWGIEEVTVTAQKRNQGSQDVGIAVAALSGDSLREQRITKPEDLANVIPNVSSLNISGGGMPIIVVRGVGLQNFRVNDSPTTAFYVDEVYQTSIVSADFTMFDLERVEMLKGPQGGLYGRNTISGAMQLISRKPEVDEAAGGYLNAEYGSYNRRQFEGAISAPLGETVAVRFSGRMEQSDDRDYNSVSNDFEHGETDRWAGRALLRATPNENTDLLFKIHGGADQSELPLLQPVATFADLGTVGPVPPYSNVGVGSALGMLCDSLASGNGVGENCAYNTGNSAADYGITGDYDSAADLGGFLDNSWQGASAHAAFTFGDYVLSSISAYDSITYRRVADLDGLPVEHAHSDYNTEIEAWSQEFRLAYEGSDTINWVVGVNYAADDLSEATFLLGKDGLLPVAYNGAEYLFQTYEQGTEASSIYGHAEWRFSEDWNLVGELRYTDEDKTFDGEERLYIPAAGGEVPFLAYEGKASFSDPSGKLALEWTPDEDMLIYASVSRGFKTGGFFGGLATSINQFEPYQSETMTAYEAGFKSDWVDSKLRLNGSVFFYDRSDVQQSATDTSGITQVTRLTNVGDVDAKGVEIDLIFQATRNLNLQLGLGYTDSEIVDSDLVSATIPGMPESSIEGTNTPNYSKLSANFLGKYERELSSALYGRVQLEVSHRSERDLNLVTNPQESVLLTEPGYTLTNLRAELGSSAGVWALGLFGENLTDERYRTLMRDNGLRGMHTLYGNPRTWGMSLTYNW